MLFLHCKNSAETVLMLQIAYKNYALGKTQVYECFFVSRKVKSLSITNLVMDIYQCQKCMIILRDFVASISSMVCCWSLKSVAQGQFFNSESVHITLYMNLNFTSFARVCVKIFIYKEYLICSKCNDLYIVLF